MRFSFSRTYTTLKSAISAVGAQCICSCAMQRICVSIYREMQSYKRKLPFYNFFPIYFKYLHSYTHTNTCIFDSGCYSILVCIPCNTHSAASNNNNNNYQTKDNSQLSTNVISFSVAYTHCIDMQHGNAISDVADSRRLAPELGRKIIKS